MVSKASGYFRSLFKGYQGVTQGNPLPPMIFKIVMDTVIHHWVTVVTPSEEGTGELGMAITYLATYFYTDNGLEASLQPERLQREFDVLTGLFERVILW